MAEFDLHVDTTYLQQFLDPILNYLSSVLPPPMFSIVETLITHSVNLLAALYNLVSSFASSQGWDTQKMLPPIITLLMAYLALVSFYRTTGWMIRTTFWFVKWGGILATLAAGAGYFMGTQGNGVGAHNGNGGGGGLLSLLSGAFLGMLNQDSSPSSGSGRKRSTRSSRPRRQTSARQEKEKDRPKSWESWDKHREWQYTADAAARDDAARANEGVQEAVQKVAGFVQEALGAGWWETVKGALEGSGVVGSSGREQEGSEPQPQPEEALPQRRAKQKQDAKGRGSSR
ncbi:hypothetical protein K466DRAFT_304269 [Polyporus arcularius HHB13444]|uniref:Uncharacterized protein n=1 Tax=Polyporus arcularius HHB13444 TaxID=1314778 RepID=A0A5C3NY47_9APHY|nr:hypothetical protein K466DRAFT_304269 [Polyporus arcularius HHB13444]